MYTHLGEGPHEFNFAGRLSHQLALQKVQQEVAGADEALTKLRNSLASVEQVKQSHQCVTPDRIIFISLTLG